jgi:hypothetical protein
MNYDPNRLNDPNPGRHFGEPEALSPTVGVEAITALLKACSGIRCPTIRLFH